MPEAARAIGKGASERQRGLRNLRVRAARTPRIWGYIPRFQGLGAGTKIAENTSGVLPRTLIKSALILVAALSLQLVGASSAADSAGDRADASALELRTERARAAAAASERRVAALKAQKQRIRGVYQQQLAEIDRLKKQPASWRRDRQVRAKLAESLSTARDLRSAERRLRTAEQRLKARQRALVRTIDAELAGAPPRERPAELLRLRRDVMRALRPPARPIVLPELELDPLADPEELEHQAALIAQAERDLAEELGHLDERARRFERMARLRETRRRAAELGALDDDGPRRFTGRGEGPAASSDSSAPPSDDAEGGGERGESGASNPAFILSEVIDEATLAALRRAERSADPEVKARAARRARAEVSSRIEGLRQRRQELEARARELER